MLIKTTASEEIPAKTFYTRWGRKHISTWNRSAENSNLKSFQMLRGAIWLWREALHLIYNYQRVTWQQTCLQVEAQYSILQLSWTSHSTLKGFISSWRQEGEAPVQSSRTRLKTGNKRVCAFLVLRCECGTQTNPCWRYTKCCSSTASPNLKNTSARKIKHPAASCSSATPTLTWDVLTILNVSHSWCIDHTAAARTHWCAATTHILFLCWYGCHTAVLWVKHCFWNTASSYKINNSVYND